MHGLSKATYSPSLLNMPMASFVGWPSSSINFSWAMLSNSLARWRATWVQRQISVSVGYRMINRVDLHTYLANWESHIATHQTVAIVAYLSGLVSFGEDVEEVSWRHKVEPRKGQPLRLQVLSQGLLTHWQPMYQNDTWSVDHFQACTNWGYMWWSELEEGEHQEVGGNWT